MDFTLVMHCDGAAFEDPQYEIARLLRQAADRIDADGLDATRTLRDTNGNTCGSWGVTE